ncbi:MAG: M56 family metallopeptidase [Nannocystaceae bacterium]
METLVLAWVITYLLHSTILVLSAWLLERRWADRPERMSGVWKTALLGGLVTASLQVGLGITPATGQWALESNSVAPSGAEPTAGAAALPAPAVALVSPSPRAPVLASWPPPGTRVDLRPAESSSAQPQPSSSSVSTEPPQGPVLATTASEAASSPWGTAAAWIVGLLGLGALLGLLSVLAAFVALRRELRGRRRLRDGPLATLLERLRRRAAVRRSVALDEAPRVQVPMAFGVLRPQIVVPPGIAAQLPDDHQETLLAHELAHVLRRDPMWRLVGLCMERVLFFQPLNRLASARVSQAAEYLCDDWAARHTRQPLALASCLTEIATWVGRPGPVVAAMSGPRSILGRRVQRLLQPAQGRGRPRWLVPALALPLAAMVVLAPGVSSQARAGDEPEARVVVIDDDGRRYEWVARDGELVATVDERGTESRSEPEPEGDRAMRRQARRDTRAERRTHDQARRRARKQMRQAFREAKRRGEPAPSEQEVRAIVQRARPEEARGRGDGQVRLHLVVPGQVEVEVHGELPPEALQGLRLLEGMKALGGLEVLQGLEGLGELEDLGDLELVEEVMEQLERELPRVLEQLDDDGELDFVRRDPARDASLRVAMAESRREHQRDLVRARRREAEAARHRLQRQLARERSQAERRFPAVRPPAPPAPPRASPRLRRIPAPVAPPAPVPPPRGLRTAPAAPPAATEAPLVWVSQPV